LKRVYLDNNATTRVDPQVTALMQPYMTEKFGNPNSLHSFGSEVREPVNRAVEQLYTALGADDEDNIVVTGCATEGNNTVLKSVYFDLIRTGQKKRIITTQLEHPSVANTCRFLESVGAEVVYLAPDSRGIVGLEQLKPHLDPAVTALVSCMWANNETGLIFPIAEIAAYCHEQGVLFHTDAVQAVGKIPVNLKEVAVDFLTFSAHKFHGPKGVGGLYIRKDVELTPLLHGGEQMGGWRSGTLNVMGIVGMGEALALATENMAGKIEMISRQRDRLEEALLTIPDVLVVGDRKLRTPNTILVSIKGVEGEALIWDLNKAGIAASTGSACASESLESNPTFTALNIDKELAHTGVRLSLSRFTTDEEINHVIATMQTSIQRLREISSSF
jgi:cysteine desulfurase